jgi:hypothetical protein
LQEIRDDPFALWSGGGDYGNLILPGDKRWRAGGLPEDWRDRPDRIPDMLIDRICEKFDPIKDKCVALGVGNHEKSVGDQFHRAIVGEIASRLGITDRYVGYQGWAIMQFQFHTKSQSVSLYQYHGWSGGRLKGRKAIQAERDLGAWDADIICLGHDHQSYEDIWYTDGPPVHSSRTGEWKIPRRARCVVNGGSWGTNHFQDAPLDPGKGWDAPNIEWGETKNYRPEGIGGAVLKIHVDMGNSTNGGALKSRPQSIKYALEKRSSY